MTWSSRQESSSFPGLPSFLILSFHIDRRVFRLYPIYLTFALKSNMEPSVLVLKVYVDTQCCATT